MEHFETAVKLIPTDKLLYTTLRQMARGHDYAWPKLETLAGRLGVSSRTIQNRLKVLEEAGLIRSEQMKIRLGYTTKSRKIYWIVANQKRNQERLEEM